MPNTSDIPSPTILHVRPDASGSDARRINNLTERYGLFATACENVYVALAHAMRAPAGHLRAAIVHLDALRPSEYEYFTLLAKYRRDIPAYVYSERGSSVAIAGAIRAGATGEVTDALFPMLAGASADRARGHRADIVTAKPAILDSRERTDSAPATSAQPDVDSDDPESNVESEPQSELKPAQDDSAETARVPWLRYGDRPVRRGPGSTAADPSVAQPATANRSQKNDAVEPLLTEEELEALMSDDFDDESLEDVERREREMLTGDDDAGGLRR